MTVQNQAPARIGFNPATAANYVICLIVVALLGYAIKRVAEAPDIVHLLAPTETIGERVALLGNQLSLVDYSFDLHRGGNLVQAVFTVANHSDRPVRDMSITCGLFDRTGEQQGVGRWVIYEMLAPNSEHRFTIDQQRYISHLVSADTISCRLTDVQMIDGAATGAPLAGHEQH